jgi:glycosyltransferase involved in cell wall biosynthesis
MIKKNLRIVSSSYGTFHMYEQAEQLNKYQLLSKFITGPPSYYAKKYNIPKNKIISMWPIFATGYIRSKIKFLISTDADNRITRLTHDIFSSQLKKKIPDDTDIFIGLSSFSLEALIAANSREIISVLDHGSLHENFDKQQLLLEKEKFGFKLTGNSSQDWLIEKENREFDVSQYIFVLSDLAKKTLIENGIEENKIIVNRCGVNLEKFIVKNKIDNIFRIVFCGQVCPRKGIHYLLEAFDHFKHLNCELWIIGSNEYEKQDHYFRKMIAKYNSNNIKFFGSVESKDIPVLFSQCSVLVHPSLSDGFGQVVLQAMACGLPVIVTNSTGASEIIKEGENGFIIKSRDIESLKDKISILYAKRKFATEIGMHAKITVQNGYSWDDYGRRLVDFLTNMKLKNKIITSSI